MMKDELIGLAERLEFAAIETANALGLNIASNREDVAYMANCFTLAAALRVQQEQNHVG